MSIGRLLLTGVCCVVGALGANLLLWAAFGFPASLDEALWMGSFIAAFLVGALVRTYFQERHRLGSGR